MLKRIIVDPRIKTKVDDLLDQPVIIRLSRFNEEGAQKFAELISQAHDTGQDVIPVIVDSYGGQVYSLLNMISEIQNSKLPVATICEAKAMSAGAALAAFGTEGYRFMAPHATLMVHEVSSFAFGKIHDLKSDVAEIERLNNLLFTLMAKHLGKSENYFLDIIHEKGHADWFLTADEAKKHGLVNHIRVPEILTTVTVNMKFG